MTLRSRPDPWKRESDALALCQSSAQARDVWKRPYCLTNWYPTSLAGYSV